MAELTLEEFLEHVEHSIPRRFIYRNPEVVQPLVVITSNVKAGIPITHDMQVGFLRMIVHVPELFLSVLEEFHETITLVKYINTIKNKRCVVVQPLSDIIEKMQNGTPITMDTKIDIMRQMISVMDTENVLWPQVFEMLRVVDV